MFSAAAASLATRGNYASGRPMGGHSFRNQNVEGTLQDLRLPVEQTF